MNSVRRHSQALESVASICLLLVILLIGVGVLVKQSRFDIGGFGMQPGEFGLLSGKQGTDEKEKTVLSSLRLDGFETLSETEVYNSENLYEKINGKAPFYTEAGFEKLYTQRLTNTQDNTLWMEIFVYDMNRPENAFSVYSRQKRPGAENLPAMGFAYKTTNALYLAGSRYYIELLGSSESAELFEAMTEIAKKISVELAVEEGTTIDELKLFEQNEIVPGSIRLYLKNAFGFEGFSNTFTAQYLIDGEAVTAFLSRQPDVENAEAAAESYRNFLIQNGAQTKSTTVEALEGKVLDFYGTTEIIFAAGNFLGGVHEAENQQTAERLALKLINRLNKTAEK